MDLNKRFSLITILFKKVKLFHHFFFFLHYVQRNPVVRIYIHTYIRVNIQILNAQKGNTNEDLRLQYSGREPRFSCQFRSSPPRVRGVGPASLPGLASPISRLTRRPRAATFIHNSYRFIQIIILTPSQELIQRIRRWTGV